MSGYIEAGYLVTLLTLSGYGATLLYRERVAGRRAQATETTTEEPDS